MRHFVTMEIVPLKWKSFLLYAPIPIPVYKQSEKFLDLGTRTWRGADVWVQ